MTSSMTVSRHLSIMVNNISSYCVLCCAARLSGFLVPVASSNGEVIVDVSMLNFIPATEYKLSCHVENTLGNRGSVESMLKLQYDIIYDTVL
jgi:hypothetical protein